MKLPLLLKKRWHLKQWDRFAFQQFSLVEGWVWIRFLLC